MNAPEDAMVEAPLVPGPKKSRWRRRVVVGLLAGLVLAFILDLVIAGTMIAPHQCQINLPTAAKYPIEAVEFPSASGAMIKGWLVPAKNSKGVVVLMHGVNASRLTMLNRVGFLYNAGYSLLLFDFQAHGESLGRHITFGYLESRDAAAAVAFARQKFPGQKVAADGVSMGGAAALLARPQLAVDALIVESVYPTIFQAIQDRMIVRFGPLGPCFTPLLTWQMKPRLGIGLDDLRPIHEVPHLATPKFFMAGDADRNTTLKESRALYEAAAGPKQLWIVNGARHEDLHHFAPKEYETRMLAFLARYMN